MIRSSIVHLCFISALSHMRGKCFAFCYRYWLHWTLFIYLINVLFIRLSITIYPYNLLTWSSPDHPTFLQSNLFEIWIYRLTPLYHYFSLASFFFTFVLEKCFATSLAHKFCDNESQSITVVHIKSLLTSSYLSFTLERFLMTILLRHTHYHRVPKLNIVLCIESQHFSNKHIRQTHTQFTSRYWRLCVVNKGLSIYERYPYYRRKRGTGSKL